MEKIMDRLCKLLLLAVAVIASGCTYARGPSNNLNFNESATLESLEGVYQNRGEADHPSTLYYLSALIWPNDRTLDHTAITDIEARKTGVRTLTVKALEKGEVKKQSIFIEGSDFTFTSGRIHLKTKMIPPSPAVGLTPGIQITELGIDSGGHGKYREEFEWLDLRILSFPSHLPVPMT